MSLLRNPFGLALITLAAIIPFSTILYMRLEGWPFLTALNFVLATITTVGYGNVYPATRAAEVFTSFLLIVGILVVLLALSTYAARFIYLAFRGEDPMEKNERALAALHDHIVVVAESGLALPLVQSLRAKNLPFAAITQEETLQSRWL
jgi:hypothetical protein